MPAGDEGHPEPDDLELELDGDGVIVSANDAAAEATGYPVDALLGSHYHQLVSPAQAGLVARQFERKRRGQDLETSYEVVIERADGGERLLEVTSRRVEEPGRPLRIRVTARSGAKPQ
jgi:PAS domain S-box-containing protein